MYNGGRYFNFTGPLSRLEGGVSGWGSGCNYGFTMVLLRVTTVAVIITGKKDEN